MPDPDMLPPGRAITPVALPAGSLDEIRRRARHRRARRAAGAGGGALLLVVAAAATVGVAAPSQDSLRVVPARPVPAPAVTPDDPGRAPGSPSARARPTGTVRSGAPTTTAEAGPAPAPRGSAPTPGVTPGAPAGPEPARPADAEPERTSSTRVVAGVDCGSAAPSTGWCLRGGAPVERERLQLRVCRAQGAGPARLRWPTSQQVDFSVHDSSGRERWSYDPPVREQPTEEEVLPGGCITWDLAWRVVDEQGERLPAGDYTLRARTTARPLQDVTVTASFTVSPTRR